MSSTANLGSVDRLLSGQRHAVSNRHPHPDKSHAMRALLRQIVSELKAEQTSTTAPQDAGGASTLVTLSASGSTASGASAAVVSPTVIDPSKVVPFGQDPETQGLFSALKGWDYSQPYAQWPDEQKRDFFEAAMGTMSRTGAGYNDIAQKARLLGVAESDIPAALARVPGLDPATAATTAAAPAASASSSSGGVDTAGAGRSDRLRALIQNYLAAASTNGTVAQNVASPGSPGSAAQAASTSETGPDQRPDASLAQLLQALLQSLGGGATASPQSSVGGSLSTSA